MKKAELIVWLVIAAICAGIGIFHGVQQNFQFMGVFLIAGVGTVVVGIVKYRRAKDEQNKKDEQYKKDDDKK